MTSTYLNTDISLFVTNKVIEDELYNRYNSKNKTTNLNNYNYIYELITEYTVDKWSSLLFHNIHPIIKYPIKYSNCMLHEHKEFKSSYGINPHNVRNARIKCSIYTLYEHTKHHTKFKETLAITPLYTFTDIYLENNYKYTPFTVNTFQEICLSLSNKLYYIELSIYYTMALPKIIVEKPLHKLLEYTFYQIDNYYQKYYDNVYLYNNINEVINNFKNTISIDTQTTIKSNQIINNYINHIFGLLFNINLNKFENNLKIDENTINTINNVNNVNNDVNNKNKNTTKKTTKSNTINIKLLNNVSSFIRACVIIKHLNIIERNIQIMELYKLSISIFTNNYIATSLVDFMYDIVKKKTISTKNFIDLSISVIEKKFMLPVKSTLSLIQKIKNGDNFREELKQLYLESATILFPFINIPIISYNILEFGKYLLTTQKITKLHNIECLSIIEPQFEYGRLKKKYTYEHSYFDISISYVSSSKLFAEQYLKAEFNTQLYYKTYQVIGIPSEIVTNEIIKPITRIEQYRYIQYINNLQTNWLTINANYLTDTELNDIKIFYFEPNNENVKSISELNGFEKAKKLRYPNDNKLLDNYRDSHYDMYNNLSGDYSRNSVIYNAHISLIDKQFTMRYLLDNGYRININYLGSFIGNIDIEINHIKNYKLVYLYKKVGNYLDYNINCYSSNILIEHLVQYVSLLKCTENYSQEFLNTYINPFISISLELLKTMIHYNIERCFNLTNYNNSLYLIDTTSMLCINYIIINAYYNIKKLNSGIILINKFNIIVETIAKLVNTTFMVSISIGFIESLLSSILLNIGFRLCGNLYNIIKSNNKKLNDINKLSSISSNNRLFNSKSKNMLLCSMNKNRLFNSNSKNRLLMSNCKKIK